MISEPKNLANAIVIIGAIYFWSSGAIAPVLGILLMLFGIAFWGDHKTKDEKELVTLQKEQISANIKNLNAATAIALANTKLILRKLQ